jgi:hypothetical protein
MQPHSIRVKLRDQPFDAFDLRGVCRRTQQLAEALDSFVYFYARLAHALMSSFLYVTAWARFRGLVDQHRLVVLHGLLSQLEPRLRHGKKRQPTLGVGRPLSDLDAISCVQLISRHQFVWVHSIPNAYQTLSAQTRATFVWFRSAQD